jgi:hypothetical protein
VVVHDAESVIDLIGPDGGAEAVASFMANRPDPGCYHSVLDSDSIVRMGRYEWTMFHCVGANSYSLGLSFACRTEDFRTMDPERRAKFIHNGAVEAVHMAAWVKATVGITVPAEPITKAEAEAGRPGFVPHGVMDPGRRTDPGLWFPWHEFLAEFEALQRGGSPVQPISGTEWSIHDLGQVMVELRELYFVYRPLDYNAAAELQKWAREDLVPRLKNPDPAKRDPRPAIEYVDYLLAAGH